MLIAKITDNNIVIGDHTELLPDTSFSHYGPTLEQLQALGCQQVTVWKEYDPATQKLVSVAPYLENGEVYTVTVESMTQDDLDAYKATLAAQIRSQRNELLKQSDWTQISDATSDKTAWATYRQALRNVPEQAQFPLSVTWPISPDQKADK